MSFKSFILLLIFSSCSINYWEKSVEISNYSLQFSFQFFFFSMYFEALLIVACTFKIVIFSWWTNCFVIRKCPFYISGNIPCSEIYFDSSLATLHFFKFFFSIIFTCLHPIFKWISYRYKIYNYIWYNEIYIVLLIQPNNLCLFIGVLRSFTFNVIIDLIGFKSKLLLFVFCSLFTHFLPSFVWVFFIITFYLHYCLISSTSLFCFDVCMWLFRIYNMHLSSHPTNNIMSLHVYYRNLATFTPTSVLSIIVHFTSTHALHYTF